MSINYILSNKILKYKDNEEILYYLLKDLNFFEVSTNEIIYYIYQNLDEKNINFFTLNFPFNKKFLPDLNEYFLDLKIKDKNFNFENFTQNIFSFGQNKIKTNLDSYAKLNLHFYLKEKKLILTIDMIFNNFIETTKKEINENFKDYLEKINNQINNLNIKLELRKKELIYFNSKMFNDIEELTLKEKCEESLNFLLKKLKEEENILKINLKNLNDELEYFHKNQHIYLNKIKELKEYIINLVNKSKKVEETTELIELKNLIYKDYM